MSGCVCGHSKSEHDNDGMCTVDHLLCSCAEYASTDLGDYPPRPRNYEKCTRCGQVESLRHHCDLEIQMMYLRGMIWWLASDLAADDGDSNSTPETWVALAERHWQLGLRFERRRIKPEGTLPAVGGVLGVREGQRDE